MTRAAGLVTLVLTLFAAGCGGPAPAPALPPATEIPRYDLEAFLDVDSWGGASFSPDNRKVVVHGDPGGVFNLYEIPVEGGDPVRLTASDKSTFSAGYFPGDERIPHHLDEGRSGVGEVARCVVETGREHAAARPRVVEETGSIA